MKLIDILVEELPKRDGWPKRANCIIQDPDKRVEHATCHPSVAKCGDDGFWFLDSSRIGGFEVDTLASDYTTAIITREQYEAALAAKNDGWIDWPGGECPVPRGTLVDVKYLCGDVNRHIKAGEPDFSGSIDTAFAVRWSKLGAEYDIIAYRLHQPQEAAQPKADEEADLNECIGQDAAPVWNGEGLPPVGCECEFISNDTSWGSVVVIGMDGDKVVIKPSGETYYGITPSERQVFRPIRSEADRKRDEAVKTIMLTGWCQTAAEEIYDLVAAGKVPGMKLED
ncbi:hypothetical protein [Flyfo siphovirus Tbat1_6]|uniref:hypothetical protein n=1 Tax=Flyfo siphovirus Tbat1_6 TaxID=2907287 RepID=UPI00233F080B|nr:hypothetical protein PRB80_gp47 [Flyfo siphovirus Tbat1_6]UIW10210.1 hypothetical protein [Flyfo siphovirus Tbat1_6]